MSGPQEFSKKWSMLLRDWKPAINHVMVTYRDKMS